AARVEEAGSAEEGARKGRRGKDVGAREETGGKEKEGGTKEGGTEKEGGCEENGACEEDGADQERRQARQSGPQTARQEIDRRQHGRVGRRLGGVSRNSLRRHLRARAARARAQGLGRRRLEGGLRPDLAGRICAPRLRFRSRAA